jgi:SulP family sulfate permease
MDNLRKYFPIFEWGAEYSGKTFINDLITGVIVTMMLIPQSLAYAQLAGLPAEVGLYASIAPLVLYAIFGTSRTLAVGPVAVGSLMTAAAVAPLAAQGTPEYLGAAIALALISGLMLIVMGLLRLGFFANFLSHPVIAGFITASGIHIAASQLGPLLGIHIHGENLIDLVGSIVGSIGNIHPYTAVIGVISLVFLVWVRSKLKPLLIKSGLGERAASMLAKAGPVASLVAAILLVWIFRLDDSGVTIVGSVPKGLPEIAIPPFDLSLWTSLAVPALLIAIIGYVESISVAMTLAAKRRQRVDPDQELIGLGAANVGSALSGGFPVTGGLSRSVVNFDAGAETPAAGGYTAIGIALTTMFLTPLLFFLPKAVLGAIIIAAVLSLVDVGALKRTFVYSKADFAAMSATILITWIKGIEAGLIVGVALSICLHLYRTSRPHIAVVGQIPGTGDFRNVKRHSVVVDPAVLSLRVDESLYFPNARFIEDQINAGVAANPDIRHVILECAAVNHIDISALESLESINKRLSDGGITFHLSEVKGPVMDRLRRSHLPEELAGKIHLTQYDAVSSINPELARQTLDGVRVKCQSHDSGT